MSARSSWRLAFPWAGAVLLLAGFVCAPTAHAGCGNYLQPLTPGMANHASTATDPGTMPRHQHKPCSGPNCSRGKQPVPAAPIVSVSVNHENAVILAALLPPALDGERQLATSLPVRASHRPALVYHPPRV